MEVINDRFDEVSSTQVGQDGFRVGFFVEPLYYFICSALVLLIFVLDIFLPRGATAAIGYCLIPVILARARPQVLVGATIVCTVLTAAGFWGEAPGAAAWMSIFDRVMVSGVLWLTYFLVNRRVTLLTSLANQNDALKAVTAELRRSNTDLEQFASTVAHDLRGPLHTAHMVAQLLSKCDAIKTNTEMVEFAGLMVSELTSMSDFIQGLLEYSRVGAHDLKSVDCDCAAIVDKVVRSIKADMDRFGAEVSNGSLPCLSADPLLMAQLFQNLIENSIKYRSQTPPRIHISATSQEDGSWIFAVRDNGIGISAENSARIFTPFCQIHEGETLTQGIGLGLATCKRIVERYGGRIWIKSQIGEGTTFQFNIPQRAASIDRPIQARPSAPD